MLSETRELTPEQRTSLGLLMRQWPEEGYRPVGTDPESGELLVLRGSGARRVVYGINQLGLLRCYAALSTGVSSAAIPRPAHA